MSLEDVSVVVNAVEHDGRNGENHTLRREPALGQNMVDQATMQPPVAVSKWVNVDKAERDTGRLQDRIDVRDIRDP